MPSVRRMILGHVISGLYSKMNRRKKLEGDMLETPMKRCLSTFDITLLGVGHMVGAGIYVLTGTVARDIAGPGVIFSFLVAGFASILAALCYAELAARVPKAGSAYVYTYVCVGEFWAFIVGWNLILEHMIGAASVARAWSGYVDSLVGGAISNYTRDMISGWIIGEPLCTIPDVLASGLCLAYAMLLGLGVKASATVNSLLTLINLAVMGLVVVLGIYYADIENWSSQCGFLPYGFGGIITGAATCFYAYVGFDSIATSGEEARDPGRSIPLATLLSMAIVIIGYMLVSGALTLVVPYWAINPTAALPEAFSSRGIPWAKYVISVGALCGMTTTLFGSLFSLPRTMYSMANDGLLFGFLGRISERTQVPVCNLIISGLLSALIALVFDLQHLVEFMSIGTLLAYTIVAVSVILLRYLPEQQPADRSNVGTPSSCSSPPTEEADSSSIASIKSELLCEGPGRFKPRYAWLEEWLEDCDTRNVIIACLLIYTTTCAFLSTFMIIVFESSVPFTKSDYLLAASYLPVLIASIFVISAHRQNPPNGKFRVPLVPLIPALSILFNVSLIMHLSPMTWLRFVVWMIVGMMIYFLYGIHYSKEATTIPNSYSVLMATSEAEKGTKWGSTLRVSPKNDKTPILSERDLVD
ncbi:cationic amino acid transporter 4 [Pogonomyrmex barbatus]|uniref:cationic amino acid transporter 4 n=1 Tax=Pogonomyrmex barbatus TaxID=144034 RepID=A0A6I9WH09_9HYME|nr:cationic amino acid transporter 4 [Pogonomyrmex barbatus]XP_011641950.1 cationic amino acid transporter 4 [Pogonomyrmex barbatus]XP_011641951.1 cationic amino acid transporter 4 [Pogonomyrmex barbatus]